MIQKLFSDKGKKSCAFKISAVCSHYIVQGSLPSSSIVLAFFMHTCVVVACTRISYCCCQMVRFHSVLRQEIDDLGFHIFYVYLLCTEDTRIRWKLSQWQVISVLCSSFSFDDERYENENTLPTNVSDPEQVHTTQIF